MGAWEVSIMSDDIAEDVDFRYKDLLENGYTNEKASQIIISEYLEELDEDELPVFWLALAFIQWESGRLQADVKGEAIQIIESGADLVRWEEDPQLMKKRAGVLHKLKKQLNFSQLNTTIFHS